MECKLNSHKRIRRKLERLSAPGSDSSDWTRLNKAFCSTMLIGSDLEMLFDGITNRPYNRLNQPHTSILLQAGEIGDYLKAMSHFRVGELEFQTYSFLDGQQGILLLLLVRAGDIEMFIAKDFHTFL